jgi:hypothetical protein
MRSTSSAGASDSGIGRCWGGGASDLERLTSVAGMGGSAAGVVEEELGSSSIDAIVVPSLLRPRGEGTSVRQKFAQKKRLICC